MEDKENKTKAKSSYTHSVFLIIYKLHSFTVTGRSLRDKQGKQHILCDSHKKRISIAQLAS